MKSGQDKKQYQESSVIEKLFEEATNSFRYEWGVRRVESIFVKHPQLINDHSLCKLGLLYDHLALKQKTDKRRKFYEAKALRLYRQALASNPRSYRALWGIGRVWWHRRDRRALPYAIRAYHLRKRLERSSGLFAQNIGLIYEALGDYKKAEYWLLRGMRENKTDFGSYINLVVFYRLIGDFKKAKKFAVDLRTLYNREPKSFKNTLWGKKISEIIKDAGRPLKVVKKG